MRAWIALAALGCGRVNFEPLCGLEGPCVAKLTINRGDEYAPGPRLAVATRVTGDSPPFDVRIAEATGDCQLVDDGWQPYAEAATYSVIVEPVDGTKKVCAWARDAKGITSTIETEALGINVDTIVYEAEQVPTVEAFDVVAVDGMLRASWTVADREGLTALDFDYTTEDVARAMWEPLAVNIAVSGTRATGTTDLPIPTSAPFFVRIVPRDRAANRGIAALSDAFNAPGWSTYLGSFDRGIGGAALAARVEIGVSSGSEVAIDPVTHDLYASDRIFGVVKLDAHTGVVERLLSIGPTNLPDDGPLPANASVHINPSLHVGPDRKLYVAVGGLDALYEYTTSAVIYQIDPDTRWVRRYLGGGTANDGSATPQTVFAFKWVYEVDEDGTIYFLTSCTPGSNTALPRMLKATQNPDGSAGTISVVAGDCTNGVLPAGGPYDPINSPLQFPTRHIGAIAAWDHGRVVHWGSTGGTTWKILDGQLFSSDVASLSMGTIAYDRRNDTLYAAHDSHVRLYRPNRSGAGGEQLLGIHVTADGTGDCVQDGVAATQACVAADVAIVTSPQRLYFVDGPRINQLRAYRVRFVDNAGTVRTYLGSLGLTGDGFDRRVMRGGFSGIAYKPASSPNQAAFPAGLYFTDSMAIALGYVDPASGRASVLWGNQSDVAATYTAAAEIGPQLSLGVAYAGGNLQPLVFDDDGLPWLRFGPSPSIAHLIKLDSSRRFLPLMTGTTPWETVADGTDPATLDLWPYGAVANVTLKGQAAFVLGGYDTANATATIRILDFAAATTLRIMGSGANAYTADRAPGTVTTASLSNSCMNATYHCFVQYHSVEDRLYFTEDHRLRFITTPSNTATATLQTLIIEPTLTRLNNFTFRPDGSQIFYLSDGQLHCHDVSSGQPWCDHRLLGPPAVFGRIEAGPNQLTWRDNNTLMISTYLGQVLMYTLP